MRDLKKRVRKVFEEIEVKEPFSTSPEHKIYEPSDPELEGVIHRLREVWTDDELTAMDKDELEKGVKRVWELVRWIHYD